MNTQQALTNLYQAARMAKLTADEHAIIVESVKVLNDFINPKKPETKSTE